MDQYDHEYSRDIEPMKGGHTDSYYYQMVDYIRRFKGVRPCPQPSGPARITIDGRFADWANVEPEYRDTIGDTAHRDHKGYGDTHYTDASGRNDIVLCKMAHDEENLYAYVKTREPLTSHTDPNWMLLFLDTDQNRQTGWQGYDYLINAHLYSAETTTLKKASHGWNWRTVARLSYRVSGNELELQAPRSQLGGTPAVDFHWADNIRKDDDITEFAVSGDSAPNRRFNYRYVTRK